MSAFIELKSVSKKFKMESGADVRVLSDIDLKVLPDETVVLLGPSGAGKSTCLKIMSGLLPATTGQILSRGQPLEGVNRDVALVLQSAALFPWETVQSNLEIALLPLQLSKTESRARIKKIIDLVGLEGFEEAYPRELSGGMKQRVGIARALVMDRPVLFLDEPFSALDMLTAGTLQSELVKIWMDKKTSTQSIVLVTHSIEEAAYMGRRILIMETNPGRVRREVMNDLPFPRDETTPAFRKLVQELRGLIVEAFIPDAPASATSALSSQRLPQAPGAQMGHVETLPHVSIVEVIGLLEAIADQGGMADIFDLAKTTGRDFGTTLYLAKAAELLDLVDTPKHNIILTDAGRRLVEGDINTRKRMMHELFASLNIVQMTTNLLRTNEAYRMPIDALTAKLTEWLPNENPDQLVSTLIAWGRFSEYFGYNDDTKEVYLDIGQEMA